MLHDINLHLKNKETEWKCTCYTVHQHIYAFYVFVFLMHIQNRGWIFDLAEMIPMIFSFILDLLQKK